MPFNFDEPYEVIQDDTDFDFTAPYEVVGEEASFTDRLKDTGIDAAKGIISSGQGLVGIADLVTGNLAGKGLAKIGYDPAKTQEILSSGYSDERQRENIEVQNAEGFGGKIKSLLENPSVAAGTVVQSAPMTIGSLGVVKALATRMLSNAGIQVGTQAAAEFLRKPEVISKLVAAGGAAEGAQTAGSIQEQAREQNVPWSESVVPAVAAGAGTAGISVLSSKIPGLQDAEVSLARALAGGADRQTLLDMGKSFVKTLIKEGPLEELPQGLQEQIFTNIALGRPELENVAEAGAEGLVAGVLQGGGMSAFSSGIGAVRERGIINSGAEKILGTKTVDEAIDAFSESISKTGIINTYSPNTEPAKIYRDQPQEPVSSVPFYTGSDALEQERLARARNTIANTPQYEPELPRGPEESRLMSAIIGSQEDVQRQADERAASMQRQDKEWSAQQAAAQEYNQQRNEPDLGWAYKSPKEIDNISTNAKIDRLMQMPEIAEAKEKESQENGYKEIENDLKTRYSGQRWQDDDGQWTGAKSSDDWFAAKNVLSYFEKKYGEGETAKRVAGSVNKNNVATIIMKLRTGGKLTGAQQEAWDYIQDTRANELLDKNKEIDSGITKAEDAGIDIGPKQTIAVGELEEGDKVAVEVNGVPDVVEHKGYDEDGNIVLEDGKKMTVDQFDKIDIYGRKQASTPEKLAAAVGKSGSISAISGRELTEQQKIKQIVTDSVGQKLDVAKAFENKGKPEVAEKIKQEAFANAQKLIDADGQVTEQAVMAELDKASEPPMTKGKVLDIGGNQVAYIGKQVVPGEAPLHYFNFNTENGPATFAATGTDIESVKSAFETTKKKFDAAQQEKAINEGKPVQAAPSAMAPISASEGRGLEIADTYQADYERAVREADDETINYIEKTVQDARKGIIDSGRNSAGVRNIQPVAGVRGKTFDEVKDALKGKKPEQKISTGEPKYSRSTTTGQTVGAVKAAISKNSRALKMLGAGKLKIVESVGELPQGSKPLYTLRNGVSIDNARKLKAAIMLDLRAAIKKYPDSVFGLRSFSEEESEALKENKKLRKSFAWEDGNKTKKRYGGTAAFKIDEDMDLEVFMQSFAYNVGGDNQKIGLIRGDSFLEHDMPESYAVIISNAKAVSFYDRPEELRHVTQPYTTRELLSKARYSKQNRQIAGAYYPNTDTMFLVAESIAKGEELSVAHHEAFHRSVEKGEVQPILDELKRLEKMAGEKSPVAKWFMSAREAAQVDKDSPQYIEEIGAYAVQGYESAPNTIKKWVDKLIAKVKYTLYQTFGVMPKQLTPAFLREVALSGLKVGKVDHIADAGKMVPVYSQIAKEYGITVEEAKRQYDAVLAEFKGTDEWMKAPNGEPTKLNERQWVQVRTPAFKEWFGGSKVVDENGEPLVVYHGSGDDFSNFSNEALGSSTGAKSAKNGFFFTNSPRNAGRYAIYAPDVLLQSGNFFPPKGLDRQQREKWIEGNAITYKVHNAKRMFTKTAKGYKKEFITLESRAWLSANYPNLVELIGVRPVFNEIAQMDGAEDLEGVELAQFVEEKIKQLAGKYTPTAEAEQLESEYNNVAKLDAEAKDWEYSYEYSKRFAEGGDTDGEYWEAEKENPKAGIYPVFLKILNPVEHDYLGEYRDKTFAELLSNGRTEGKDGAIFRRVADPLMGDVYVTFSPNQIKSATGNTGQFSPDTDDIRYSQKQIQDAAKAIYSKLEQVASSTFQGMKAQSVLNFLNKQGVKKAEIEATGLDAWVTDKKPADKVTREELLDFVRANAVELEYVVLGEKWDEITSWIVEKPSGERSAFEDKDSAEEYASAVGVDPSTVFQDISTVANLDVTHFSQYTEPGAEEGSYREMFVTAPGKIDEPGLWDAKRDMGAGGNGGYRRWFDGHSQYDSVKNPVVRIRFNTVESDGKRYLRIEEMQGPNPENQKKMPSYLKDNIYQIGVKRILAYAKENGFNGVGFATRPNLSAGETQADRYSLEKQVSSIDYHKDTVTKDSWWLYINDNHGAEVLNKLVPTAELESIVGKDVAGKIIQGEGTPLPNRNKRLSGLDLKITSTGLVKLYDQDLPRMLEAYGKGKMGELRETQQSGYGPDNTPWTELSETQREKYAAEEGAKRHLPPFPFLPLTDKTPASYPLFSRVAPIIEETFDVPEKHTVAATIKAAFDPLKFKKENVKKTISKARTQLIDKLHPIEVLGDVPYKLHSLLNNTHAVIGTFLQHGKLAWKDNALIIENQKDEGFLPWLHSLGEDGRNLFYWIAAKRAELLEAEGRENWLTPDKRKKIMSDQVFKGLSPQERIAKEKEFAKLNDKFQEYNQNVIDIAVEAGLISKAQTNDWMRDFYLPFYRILEDEATHDEFLQGPAKSRKFISAQIKRLKGGEEKLGDPLENILRNWTHLIQESQRNVARSAAADVMVKEGYAEVVPGNETFKSPGARRENFIISYQKDGKAAFMKVNDVDLFEALSNANAKVFDSTLLKILTGAKRLFTAGATFTAAFRVANMFRDTIHTAVVTKSFIPFVDTAKGFAQVWKESPDYIALSASGGGFAKGYIESGDPKAMARGIEKILAREGQGTRGNILDTPRRILNFWERVGTASEMAARVQLYSNLKMKGETHLEASFRARDLLDFYKSGAGNSIRVIMATTPFLNARIQGLDRLYRGAKEDKAAFFTKGAIVAGASLLLWAAFKDDERYKELEDWEKWQYHHFWIGDTHFRMPKAFEVGAIFSSLFESAANVAFGDEDMEFFGKFLSHTLTQTFSLSFPAAFGPSIEVYANKSAFTGRDIESMGQRRLPPGERSDPWTPEFLKDLGRELNISPKKVEHIVRGHTAAFGLMFMTVTDAFYRAMTDTPSRPAMRIEDIPGAGRFVRGEESRTKYATRYYEFAKEVDELAMTISNYKNIGDLKMARQVAKENTDLLQHKRYINKTKLLLSAIRKEEKKVWSSNSLTPEQKKEKLRELFKKKNKVLQSAYTRTHQ